MSYLQKTHTSNENILILRESIEGYKITAAIYSKIYGITIYIRNDIAGTEIIYQSNLNETQIIFTRIVD